jgi:hydroxyacylglutathione hydrolase
VILRNFYNDKLAQASYLIGCGATGEAMVIDPIRDPSDYMKTAQSLGLRITAVTETHIHADYLSGTRELAAATGATTYLSDEGGPDWTYDFGQDPGVVLMKDGHNIRVGNLTIRATHTPGHTPEHMTFLLTDNPLSDMPHSLFSGDCVFAGDVGRPDLLEKAARVQGSMEPAARQLYASLQGIRGLPDSLLVWPGHGAGSACGKALGGSPVTTLGYERATNWAFQAPGEEEFVNEVLSGQPEPPAYFKTMKALNRRGPRVLGDKPQASRLREPVGQLVDVRSFDWGRGCFLPGTLLIPRMKSQVTWAGWLLDYEEPFTLVAESQMGADAVAYDLSLIGLDNVAGWLPADEVPGAHETVPQVRGLEVRPDDYLLDIRGMNEWRASRIEEAKHIPLGYLPSRVMELPRDRRIVVFCSAGGRSPTGYSIVRNAGFENVVELAGGLEEAAGEIPRVLLS